MEALEHTQTDEKSKIPEKTQGEKIFDFTNYYGINFFLNSFLSIVAADFAQYRPLAPTLNLFGKEHNLFSMFSDAIDWGSKQGQAFRNFLVTNKETFTKEDIIKAANDLKHNLPSLLADAPIKELVAKGQYTRAFYDINKANINIGLQGELKQEVMQHISRSQVIGDAAKSLAGIVALCAGGWLLMFPVKALEDNKVAVTRWMDEKIADPIEAMLGKAPKNEIEANIKQEQREARYDYIDRSSPRQSAASVIIGRAMALLPIYALHISWWKENNVIKHTAGKIAGVEANPDPEVGFGGAGKYIEGVGEKAFGALYENSDLVKKFANAYHPKHDDNNNLVLDPKTTPYAIDGKKWSENIGALLSSEMFYSLGAAFAFENISKGLSAVFHKDKTEEQPEVAQNSAPSEKLKETQHEGRVEEKQQLQAMRA
ncbi:MAG: hypothetical protein EAZ74_02510 [Alphaproteobacteria bacterium]|nr:MAG: hypothetical protein EAZ74_02510 [Alphaproteobacteria bacterium]